MKKLLCLAFGILLMNLAYTINDPVPDSMLLSDLPPRSKLLFQNNLDFKYESEHGSYRASWGGEVL